MWDDAIGWGIAVLGLAISANWLSSREDRSLRRIKAEAEVLELLPDGDGRTRLLEQIERRLRVYIDGPEDYRNFWTYPPMGMIFFLQLLFGGTSLLALLVLDDEQANRGVDFWVFWPTAIAMTAVTAWGVVSRVVSIKDRQRRYAELAVEQ